MRAAAVHGPLLGVGVDETIGVGVREGIVVPDANALGGTGLTETPDEAQAASSTVPATSPADQRRTAERSVTSVWPAPSPA